VKVEEEQAISGTLVLLFACQCIACDFSSMFTFLPMFTYLSQTLTAVRYVAARYLSTLDGRGSALFARTNNRLNSIPPRHLIDDERTADQHQRPQIMLATAVQ
jgi:hypothetical protein